MDQQIITLLDTSITNMTLPVFHKDKIGELKLEDMKGRWFVLFFYPANFTFVCPTELEELAGMYTSFQDIEVEIVSVSTDTAFAHKAWHDQSDAIAKVEFPMAADPTGELTKSLGIYKADEGVAYRGTFIIDPEGKIRAYEVNDKGVGRSAKELFRKVKAAQFVAKHGDKVCPAGWENDGDDTLTPGVELVGKI
jgi:peroxiredoxin (alkyl hydroperoxide reductase subunit C)